MWRAKSTVICSRFLFDFIARDGVFGALGEAFSKYRLMAEQRMLGLAAGDLQHHSLSLKVSRVMSCLWLFYNLFCFRRWNYLKQYSMDWKKECIILFCKKSP